MSLNDLELYSSKKRTIPTKNRVFLNERVNLNLSEPEKASNVVFFGSTGSGKTIGVCVFASQFENAIFFDPKPGYKAWESLKEINEHHNWQRFDIHDSVIKRKRSLKINTQEISPGVINVLCLKKESSLETRLRRLLWPFFAKKHTNPTKTFDNLERLLLKNRFDSFIDEFKVVLDENDNGMTMEELCSGRKVISISDFDSDNRGISLLIGNIFFYKGNKNKNKKISLMQWKERLFIGCDECHTHVKSNTTIGTAMAYVFSQGRSFGITGCVSGTNEEPLPTMIKSNIRILFLFSTAQEKDKFFKKYNVDLDDDSFNFLREKYPEGGNCFLKAEDFGYIEPIPIHINFYYKKLRQQKRFDEVELMNFSSYV